MAQCNINADSIQYKASINDIFKALISEAQWLPLFKVSLRELKSLIDIIIRESKESDSIEYKTPSIKTISNEIGTTSAKVSKFLNQIYEDIWELNLAKPELFFTDSKYCTFYFKDSFGKQYAYFNLGLSQTINVGDNFSWNFLIGKFSTTSFYVESIDHEHKNGCMETAIHLKTGYYNSYRQLLMNKASFLNLIDFDEMIALSDYKIDELLYHRVEKGLSGFPESMAKEAEYFGKKKNQWY